MAGVGAAGEVVAAAVLVMGAADCRMLANAYRARCSHRWCRSHATQAQLAQRLTDMWIETSHDQPIGHQGSCTKMADSCLRCSLEPLVGVHRQVSCGQGL